jgi:hypothetical protein
MSCWVVPSLAAEYLGITLEQLMMRVSAGAMDMRSEDGFDMIDVAPNSPRHENRNDKAVAPKPANPTPRPCPPADAFDADERDTFGDWRTARALTARTRKAPVLS